MQNEKKSIDKFANSNYNIISVCKTEQARFGYTNQQMADKSMMFATDNEPREKGGDNDRNDGYFWLSVSSVDLELSVPSSTGEHVS